MFAKFSTLYALEILNVMRDYNEIYLSIFSVFHEIMLCAKWTSRNDNRISMFRGSLQGRPYCTLRDTAIEDPITSFRDIKKNLKTRIWLEIQNGNLDHHQNAHCTSSDKGLYMSGVSWVNVMRFRRFAIPIADVEGEE